MVGSWPQRCMLIACQRRVCQQLRYLVVVVNMLQLTAVHPSQKSAYNLQCCPLIHLYQAVQSRQLCLGPSNAEQQEVGDNAEVHCQVHFIKELEKTLLYPEHAAGQGPLSGGVLAP